MRPEHLHYETIEKHLQKCIKNGCDFFFDTKLFDEELTRLWDTYDVPYEVRNRIIMHARRVGNLLIRFVH